MVKSAIPAKLNRLSEYIPNELPLNVAFPIPAISIVVFAAFVSIFVGDVLAVVTFAVSPIVRNVIAAFVNYVPPIEPVAVPV